MPIIDRVMDKSMLVEGQLRVDVTFMRTASDLSVTSRKWEKCKKEKKSWDVIFGRSSKPWNFLFILLA